MAVFAERNIGSKLDILRPAFLREYAEICAAWAEDPIHDSSDAYSTGRTWRMVEIADEHLERIAP